MKRKREKVIDAEIVEDSPGLHNPPPPLVVMREDPTNYATVQVRRVTLLDIASEFVAIVDTATAAKKKLEELFSPSKPARKRRARRRK